MARLKAYMPRDLLEKIRSQGRTEGERRPVTVLVADLSGFTALSQRLDPEEVKSLTNECLETMARVVFKYEGYVDKFIGDAVMALFGAPVIHEDDPERALRCALEMREAIRALPHDLDLHIGVHSGEVIAGTVGPDLRMEYTVLGDAVNFAARLEETALSGQILVSQTIQRRTQGLFEFKGPITSSLPGVAEPMPVFELQRALPRPERVRGIEGLTSQLVGRNQELAMACGVIDELLRGRGQILMVLGEPGIGKTRLVEEARRYAQEQYPNQMRWLVGRALSYGQAISYWPLREILRTWAAIAEEDSEAKAFGKLRVALRRLFPDRPEEILPYLATLLTLRLEGPLEEKVRYLDAEALSARILLSFSTWMEALANEKPLVLYLEDFHWADTSTVALLEELIRITDRAPVALVFAARAEREAPSWRLKVRAESDYAHRYREIHLQPLTTEESDLLVSNLLEIADFPSGVRKLVLQKAEGNPFFVEEVIRALIEEGVLIRQDGHWRATARVLDVVIPETLQGVLLARIDRLQPSAKRILQTASVIGRSFLYRLLEAVAEPNSDLQEGLTTLQRADLVRELSRIPEVEYIFKHPLTQEVTYHTLLTEQRRLLHRKVGEALETLFPERNEDYIGLLAHHFTQAGERQKAINYLMEAGQRARKTYANREAIEYYRKAYDYLQESSVPDEQRKAADLLVSWGEIHFTLAEAREALTRYDTAVSLYQALGDRGSEARTLYWVSRVYRSGLNDYPKAAEMAQQGLVLAEEVGDPPSIAYGYETLAASLFWGGIDSIRGKEYAHKALAIFETLQDFHGLGDVHHSLALMTDDLDDAVHHNLKSAEYRLQVDDLPLAAWSFNNAATQSYIQGNLSQATEYVKRGIELAEKSGAVLVYCILQTTLCETLIFLGKLEDARAVAERNLELAQRIGNRQLRFFGEFDLGFLALAEGHWLDGREHLQRARELSGATSPFLRGIAAWLLAECHLALDELQQAKSVVEDALHFAQEDYRLTPIALRVLGRVRAAEGDWSEAEQAFQDSLRLWEEVKTHGLDRWATVRDYGLLLLRRGQGEDTARGKQMLKEALAFFASKGDVFNRTWAERGLSELGLTLQDIEDN
ncbi:MAG: AAA family ATPase [Chloroflexi bacterium]|nr:AAA family ATPase [Chloroflexota bacterium]